MTDHLNREQRLYRKVDLGQRTYPEAEPAVRRRRPKRLKKQMVTTPSGRSLEVMLAARDARMAVRMAVFMLSFLAFADANYLLLLLIVPVATGLFYLIDRLEQK